MSGEFDRLFAAAIPLAAVGLGVHRAAPSFLESYLEQALSEALGSLDPELRVTATGHSRVELPDWDRKLGGFDLRVLRSGEPSAEALVETKVDELGETLWDLFKLAGGLRLAGVEFAYLILARESHLWRHGECAELFAESERPRLWDSAQIFSDWSDAWAELIGPRGGSARPTSIPAQLETAFIARAPVAGFDRHELRCVAVRVVPAAERLRFEDGWPVSG